MDKETIDLLQDLRRRYLEMIERIDAYMMQQATKEKEEAPVSHKKEDKDRLIPASRWHEYYSWPTKNSLRQYIFYNTLGFNSVVKRCGRKVFIDEKLFLEWQKSNPQPAPFVDSRGREIPRLRR